MQNFIRLNKATLLSLAIGIVFILIGAFRGEIAMVFDKAISICLECIGIG